MPKTLLIVVESPRTDSYVNVVCHAHHGLEIGQIRLLYGTCLGIRVEQARELERRIRDQLSSMSKGKYLRFPDSLDERVDTSKLPHVSISDDDKVTYQQAAGAELRIEGVEGENLLRGLRNVMEKYDGVSNCTVDMTGAAKLLLFEVFAALLALRARDVYVFGLRFPPDSRKPERSMYHALAVSAFSYTRVTDLPSVRDAKTTLTRTGLWLSTLSVAALAVGVVAFYVEKLHAGWPSIALIIGVVASLANIVSLIVQMWQLRTKSGELASRQERR